jgi:phosphoglycerate dehydrogenase-like enzyme
MGGLSVSTPVSALEVWLPHEFRDPDPALFPAEVRLWTYRPETLAGHAAVAPTILVAPLEGRAEFVAALPSLNGLILIQSLDAGVDWLVDHVPSGVVLANGSGVHDASVAEWVLAAVLFMLRRFDQALAHQHAQRWSLYEDERLEGKTALIVGYGSIGSAVEARLRPFGVSILRVARSARRNVFAPSDLPRLVREADIVILTLPLTHQTKGMFNAEILNNMRRGALLVNASRGGIVVTADLVDVLEKGHIRAALDVTDPEPLPPGHRLWDSPNLLITPHLASQTIDLLDAGYRLVAEQTRRVLSGAPLMNVVEPPD